MNKLPMFPRKYLNKVKPEAMGVKDLEVASQFESVPPARLLPIHMEAENESSPRLMMELNEIMADQIASPHDSHNLSKSVTQHIWSDILKAELQQPIATMRDDDQKQHQKADELIIDDI